MSVQARGQPAAIVPTITQTPKAIIPAEIKNESTVSMIGPFVQREGTEAYRKQKDRPKVRSLNIK